MIFDASDPYPGVRKFASTVKSALMAAHDAILATRVKQTKTANKHRKPAPFKVGDLVYVETKNMRLAPGRSRKLTPNSIYQRK
ncbi:hypothetical protein SISSUDRAFT_1028941 [Sistotremastrum suecicum HHB10207 ss-3]|uniref:Uncharacterized protein n=1 Tax=Sistotremastrum suecicum HHB10207 ss-3 TaxID=1314776 RepID=A0A165WYB9_9AGAM|nr:hypothetical protein SISSUDRAFT_1028941 [Sistotremastrum suecicum HHB10207 ss-3]